LRHIGSLVTPGVHIAGIGRIIDLEAEDAKLREELAATPAD
jgi:hypothetical protein